jgi:hypothetical protein
MSASRALVECLSKKHEYDEEAARPAATTSMTVRLLLPFVDILIRRK